MNGKQNNATATNILIRMPNWLGDMVMSIAFLQSVRKEFPGAKIGLIVKKGLEELVPFIKGDFEVFIFSKKNYNGLKGQWKFGSSLRATKWHIYFCLPSSFSTAVVGFAAGAKHKVGYKNEGRSFLLTHAYKPDRLLHRADVYTQLLYNYISKPMPTAVDYSLNIIKQQQHYMVVNINSEATSRRIPVEKAASIILDVVGQTLLPVKLLGTRADEQYVETVVKKLQQTNVVAENIAGKTSIAQMIQVIANARVMLSTDSGPAHVANILQTPVVVLFGAGNENETGPYNKLNATVYRLNKLPCEPCVKNTCRLAPLPVCMQQLNEGLISKAVVKLL
jgi:heptosyltransferase II